MSRVFSSPYVATGMLAMTNPTGQVSLGSAIHPCATPSGSVKTAASHHAGVASVTSPSGWL
jgi:hypothetical protein